MDIKEIKELAKKFTPEQIEECISRQLETGSNPCVSGKSGDAILNELSEASFVKNMMSSGKTLSDALRELARRIRRVTASEDK